MSWVTCAVWLLGLVAFACMQTVGMNAAGLAAVIAGIAIDWFTVGWAVLGGCTGVLIGAMTTSDIEGDWVAVLFASLWCGFAFCLFVVNRLGDDATCNSAQDMVKAGLVSKASTVMTIFGFSFLGGIISLLTGLGVDTIAFALVVLRFRVREHVAQVCCTVV